MSYALAMERLAALGAELHTAPGQPRRKFELGQMRALMAELKDPQHAFASILVAGTNGKGSTASTLASILQSAGYRTGLYTSPHLERVNERIQIYEGGVPEVGADETQIEDEEFAALFFRVQEAASRLVANGTLPGMPSFFETVTAIGFLYFASREVHTAVLEVGMGGRLDATNIVQPVLSIVTDISLDHMEWLGSTIAEIAREKAGILRRDGVMVTLPQHPEANQALGEVASELNVRGVNAAVYVPLALEEPGYAPLGDAGNALDDIGPLRNRYRVTIAEETVVIDSPLAGAHQRRNVALAIAAAVELSNNHGYDISLPAIAEGVRNTRWPARLEFIPGNGVQAPERPDGRAAGRADVLLDVCHNPAGAWALRSAVSQLGLLSGLQLKQDRPLTLVFGCLKDKPLDEMAQILFPLFDQVVVTPLESPRSSSREDLMAAAAKTGARVHAAEDPVAALTYAFEKTPPHGLIVIAGSVYLVGTLRSRARFGAVAETTGVRA